MTRPLKILVAHYAPSARTGGVSRIMSFIHDEVAKAGHQVEFFCSDSVSRSIPVRMRRHLFPLAVWRRAVSAARKGRPFDIINVHEAQGAALCVFRSSAGHPKVVVTSHGLEQRAWRLALEEASLGREGPSLRTRVTYPLTTLWQSRLSLHHCDHVMSLSEEDMEYLNQSLHVPRKKMTRMLPGAQLIFARAAEQRDYARAERILFAATWRKNKGIEDLVPAIVALMTRHAALTLTVQGAGVESEVVRGAFPSPLRDRVICLTTTNESESAAGFAQSDLFVLPSLFEGTPLTLMEAMMSGLPVVTTATCGMKDVIQDGRNGILIPRRSPEAIGGALERLIADRRLREQLGRAAREDAIANYTWEKVAVPIREAYEQLGQSQPRGEGRT